MAQRVNLEEIKAINKEDFAAVLKEWSSQDHISNTFQSKMRRDLFDKFNKTSLGQHVSSENRKFIFDPLTLILNSLIAEFLYVQGMHFTLSVLFSESRYSQSLPNFQRMDQFKFVPSEITELLGILGISKSYKSHNRILNSYKETNEPLLNILVKYLVHNQKKVSVSNAGTQTNKKNEDALDDSQKSFKSNKSKIKKRKRKHHGLSTSEYIKFKPKISRPSNINIITENLVRMSDNIGLITKKLDQFKESESTDLKKNDSAQEIIQTVGKIVVQLDGCVNHFEKLCTDIKMSKNDSSDKKFDDWMGDMKHSDSGQKFLKKLQKSFTKIVKEERSKIKRDYRKKLSNEMYKSRKNRSKQIQLTPNKNNSFLVIEEKLKNLEAKEVSIESRLNKLDKQTVVGSPAAEAIKITNEINKMFKNTCVAINNIDKECEIFEKSLETNLDMEKIQKVTNVEEKLQSSNKLDQKLMQNKFKYMSKYEKLKTSSSSSNNITISSENSLISEPELKF